MKPNPSAAADLAKKLKIVRINITEQYVRAVQRNDQNTFKSLRHAKDDLAEIETALEAQQTDDTLSGLRTQIEARIKVLEGHHARWVLGGHKLDIVASQEHIHGLAEALSFIDSAEARKKK